MEDIIKKAACPHVLRELIPRHNEPVIDGFYNLARLIGYAEDDRDCYLILQSKARGRVWHTAVGGYYFLTPLKGQNVLRGSSGEDWNDLWRLDQDLTRMGVPPTAEFEIILYDQSQLPERHELDRR